MSPPTHLSSPDTMSGVVTSTREVEGCTQGGCGTGGPWPGVHIRVHVQAPGSWTRPIPHPGP